MAIEKWLAVTSVALFAMFAGEMISVYNFMVIVDEDFEFARSFDADPKIIQFVSIGVAPAGILAAVAFIMSRQYGSRQIGGLIIVGGIILLAGMLVCYSMLEKIDEIYLTDAVKLIPILFMALSPVVIVVGIYLSKQKKKRPKKEYF
jgi:hypothetical protein